MATEAHEIASTFPSYLPAKVEIELLCETCSGDDSALLKLIHTATVRCIQTCEWDQKYVDEGRNFMQYILKILDKFNVAQFSQIVKQYTGETWPTHDTALTHIKNLCSTQLKVSIGIN